MKDASAWEKRFDRFIEPFLEVWRSKKRRQWAPIYLRGLLLPGERKSIEPVAATVIAQRRYRRFVGGSCSISLRHAHVAASR